MSTTIEHKDDHGSTTSTMIETNPHNISMAAVLSILSNSEKGRSAIEGNIYHLHLAVMIILRAYRMRSLDNEFDFLVAMEVSAAGKFDDVLYHYLSPRLSSGTLFVQAKHKGNKGSKLEQDTLCPSQEDSKSTYSIPMYFVSFLEVDQKLTKDARYVLCTNAGLHNKIEDYFKKIDPRKDNSLLFCDDIGATCYQFDWEKPFPGMNDKLQDACLNKLGKELAQIIFKGNCKEEKEITFNDTLYSTFVVLINECIEPLEQETTYPSESNYQFTQKFFNADKSSTIGKLRSYFEKEYETLLKNKNKPKNNNTTNKPKIKIDRDSFTAAKETAEAGYFQKFDQKVREFYEKFVLVCNSYDENRLSIEAMTLLPQWCGADRKTIIDKLKIILLDAMKSVKRVPIDLRHMQAFFLETDLKQNISDLLRSSTEYQAREHCYHIEVNPEYLNGCKLYAFLGNNSDCGIYEFNSTLDLRVSSRILLQALTVFQQETIFVDSTVYGKQLDLNAILDDLLSYLRDVNHSTIKVITILGKLDRKCMNDIKKLSEKYCQKIVVVQKMSRNSQTDETIERILVKNLSDGSSGQLYKKPERMMFGTNTPLNGIVEETDDLSFLLDVLELCDQSRGIKDHNLNYDNYNNIKQWYVNRQFVPYEQDVKMELHYNPAIIPHIVRIALTMISKQTDPPRLLDDHGGKVCIFLNDAGFGKTTYFTWLAWHLSTVDRSLFVIKFNARDYSTDFKRLDGSDIRNLEDTKMVRLLYRYVHMALFVPSINSRKTEDTDVVRNEADRCANLMTFSNGQIILDETQNTELSTKELIELRLFREKFNQRKLVMILDGFDEAAPYYEDVVMNCFARFVRFNGVRSLYMSSRPYGFEKELRKTFAQCRIYKLNPYSSDDILNSLNKFLRSNLDGYEHYQMDHRMNIVEKLYRIMIHDLKDIISVPLLLYMVQIILLPEIRKRVNENTNTISDDMLKTGNLDILYLIEQFIHRKIKILNTDKTGSTDAAGTTAAARKNLERLKKEIKEHHMLLALCVIFDSKDREKLLSVKEQKRAVEIMQDVNQGDEKTGIVLGIQNGMPQFLHRIFAEFFTACWLYENFEQFQSKSIFRSQTFWSPSLKKCREFFDRLVLRDSEGCALHLALVNKSREEIDEILRTQPSSVDAKDNTGRLPLHMLYYLLDIDEDKNEPYLMLFKQLDEVERILKNEQNGELEFINQKDKLYGWNAMDYAFVFHDTDLIDRLLLNGVKPNMDNLFQQVCSNNTDQLLVQVNRYVNTLYFRMEGLAEDLSERVVKYLIEDHKLDIFSPLAELNSCSVLEKVVSGGNVVLFHHLITKCGPEGLGLDDRASRLLTLSLEQTCEEIALCLVERNPSLVPMINNNFIFDYCAIKAVENNHMELFKAIFSVFCIKQNIECVEERNIVDEFGDQGEHEPFEVENPCEYYCCYEEKDYDPELKMEGLLYATIYYGNVHMTSYIIQKTNMVVTIEVIEQIMQELRKEDHSQRNHKKCIPAFKYLFKKAFDRYAIEEDRLSLFLAIIKYGCVYMLHSLIAIGFNPKTVDMANHWDVIQHRLLCSDDQHPVSMFLYLQRQSYVDCFDPFGPTGESIFDIAITNSRFTIGQALMQEKFCNLSVLEKENAEKELIHQLKMKYGDELSSRYTETLLRGGTKENEM